MALKKLIENSVLELPQATSRRRRYQILREDVVVCLCVLDVLKGIL